MNMLGLGGIVFALVPLIPGILDPDGEAGRCWEVDLWGAPGIFFCPHAVKYWHEAAKEVFQGSGVGCHQNVDVILLYFYFQPVLKVASKAIRFCLKTVEAWMKANKLTLNQDRLE